jgi:hypothetical protein
MFIAISCQEFTSTMTWNVIYNFVRTPPLPLGNNDVHTRSVGPAVISDLSQAYVNILKILNVFSISAFGISNTAFLRVQFLTYREYIILVADFSTYERGIFMRIGKLHNY